MKLVTHIRARAQGVFARPFQYFSAEWERMAPRERRLVTGLAIAVIAVGTALAVFLIFTNINDLEAGNADIREALGAITKHRDDYLEAKARMQAQDARLGSEPPQIVADIEAAAREESVQIAESNERPSVGAGKRWLEHDVDLKIRGVDLQALTNFMRRVETGTRPIFFTYLSLKRRFSEADKLDAELTASAFERVSDGAPSKKKPDGKGNKPDTKSSDSTRSATGRMP